MISRVNFEFRISIFDLAGDSYLGSWPPGPSFLRERNAIEPFGSFWNASTGPRPESSFGLRPGSDPWSRGFVIGCARFRPVRVDSMRSRQKIGSLKPSLPGLVVASYFEIAFRSPIGFRLDGRLRIALAANVFLDPPMCFVVANLHRGMF